MAASYNDLRHPEVLTASFDDITSMDISLDGSVYTITSKGTGDEKTFYYGEEEIAIDDLQSALEIWMHQALLMKHLLRRKKFL